MNLLPDKLFSFSLWSLIFILHPSLTCMSDWRYNYSVTQFSFSLYAYSSLFHHTLLLSNYFPSVYSSFISPCLPPCLHRIEPRYLYSFTSSIYSPYCLISYSYSYSYSFNSYSTRVIKINNFTKSVTPLPYMKIHLQLLPFAHTIKYI